MLLILFAGIIISFTCFLWGKIIFGLLKKSIPGNAFSLHFSFSCLLGLGTIIILSQLLSLFIPLGGWLAKLIILIPAIIFFILNFQSLKASLQDLKFLKFIPALLIVISILLLLVMSSWKIVHPDTLGYHAQNIQWLEKYKAIPGIVHLHPRFGFQSVWFAANAIFSFKFFETNNVTFLNTTVLIWYLFFVFSTINNSIRLNRNYSQGILLLILFLASLWSYTQIRLTATSASPDFITTIFIWSAIFLLLEKKNNTNSFKPYQLILASLLSMIAVTLKLSAAPILIIPAYSFFYFLKEKKIRLLLITISISILTFAPFITRNIISSGYPLYPTTLLNFAHVDWKFSIEKMKHEKDYITAYARMQSENSYEEVERVLKLNYSEWIPLWWQNLSMADKTILFLLIISFFISAFRIKKILTADAEIKIVFLTAITGIVFWFLNAPDPRFGFGFIIGFMLLIFGKFLPELPSKFTKNILLALLSATFFTLSVYSVYRFSNFYKKHQWAMPLGIKDAGFITTDCHGININSPEVNAEFGNIPIPCTNLHCGDFIPRGSMLTDGFRSK